MQIRLLLLSSSMVSHRITAFVTIAAILLCVSSSINYAEAQNVTIGEQSPFPYFANFPLCSLATLTGFQGYCINQVTGIIETWGGESTPAIVPEGAFYTVASILSIFANGTEIRGACAVRRNTWEVVCWDNPILENNIPPGTTAFRVSVGENFACALHFDPSTVDVRQLVLINPADPSSFYNSVEMRCWGIEYQTSSGNTNLNFALPANPSGDNPPVEIFSSFKYTCVQALNGLFTCGGRQATEFDGTTDVSLLVDTSVTVSVFQVERDRFCYVESDEVTKACVGSLCTLEPALCDMSTLSDPLNIQNLALALAFNGGIVINGINELEFFGFITPVLPQGKYKQIYGASFLDQFCAIGLQNGEIVCFGAGDISQPPPDAYFAPCANVEVKSATLLELVNIDVNPYLCLENGQSSSNRFEWDIAGNCTCYPRQVSNLFSYDRNLGTCGIAPFRYVTEAIDPLAPGCQ